MSLVINFVIFLAIVFGLIISANRGKGQRGYYIGLALLSIPVALLFGLTGGLMTTNKAQADSAFMAFGIFWLFVDTFIGGVLGACFYKKAVPSVPQP